MTDERPWLTSYSGDGFLNVPPLPLINIASQSGMQFNSEIVLPREVSTFFTTIPSDKDQEPWIDWVSTAEPHMQTQAV